MQSFFDRFQRIVAERAGDIAIIDDRGSLTFGDLNAASDQVAAMIFERSEGRNDVFGFLGGPTRHRTIAYMACLKAGAGMVNINTDLPGPVLHDVMATCGAARILAAPGFMDQARTILPTDPLAIPEDAPSPSAVTPFSPVERSPDSILGIQNTSGSTGRPKCVPYRAGPLAFRMARRETLYGRPGTVPHRHIHFNHLRAMSEFWIPLCGDSLVYYDLRQRGIADLIPWLRETEVTELPGQLAILRRIMAAAQDPFEHIMTVNAVGEAATRADIEAFERTFPPGATLYTVFAATEHCDLAFNVHRHGDPIEHDVTPLGRILNPDDVRIVREDGQTVQPGEPGEIHVTGGTLAGDYLNDPERTAEAYFRDAEGVLWFRTNFLARQDRAGILHGLGRKDDQVKIRGFNVRPSEIEQMVRDHPTVEHAAVTPFEGAGGIRRLACYVVPKGDVAPDLKALRAFLAARAPNYMVPSVIRRIDALPTGPTGKVLKQALPDPLAPSSEAQADRAVGSACSVTAKGIAEAWRLILGHGDFGDEDDFFDVGGDSLQAMTLLLALEERFGIRLTLDALILKGASIPALADQIDGAASAPLRPSGGLVTLRAGNRRAPLIALPVAAGHLSDYLALAQTLSPDQPVLGLRPRGLDRGSLPARSIEDMAADALDVLAAENVPGPYRLMGFSFGGYIALEMARVLIERGQPASHLIVIDPFVGWADRARYPRVVVRHLLKGNMGGAWMSARTGLSGIPGLQALSPDTPQDLDDLHRLAVLRYVPAPLPHNGTGGSQVTLISARHNVKRDRIRPEWRRLIGPALTIREIDANHIGVMRPPAVWALAEAIEETLGRPHQPEVKSA
ncbi:MAG: alpha/beta fold hydrolase [Alphaproteobacteria bacterium]